MHLILLVLASGLKFARFISEKKEFLIETVKYLLLDLSQAKKEDNEKCPSRDSNPLGMALQVHYHVSLCEHVLVRLQVQHKMESPSLPIQSCGKKSCGDTINSASVNTYIIF